MYVMIIPMNNLGYRNIDVEEMIEQLQKENEIIKGIVPFPFDDKLISMVYFAPEVTELQV